MQPKLIIGLNSISKEDWTSYRKYILMQTVADSEAYSCFLVLQKHAKKLEQFDTSKWHKKFMPHLTEKAFLNILSKLYLWLEEWIVYNNIKADKVRSGIELVKYFNRRGLFKLADKKAHQVQQLIDKHTQRSDELDFNQYQLYYYQFYSDNPIKDHDQSLVIKLMTSFLKWKNNTSAVLLAQLNFWNTIRAIDQKLYMDLTKQLDIEISDPLLLHLNKLILEENIDSFEYCFHALKKGQVSQKDDLFTLLTMFLIGLSNRLWHLGKFDTPQRFIEIYEFALENDVLMNAGKIPHRRFLNIVSTLGAFNSFGWTNSFIEKWGDSVLSSDIEGTKRFAKANNYFNHGQFDEALEIVQQTNTDQINLRLNIHELAIKLYYDTKSQNYDPLITAIDKYQAFIRRRVKRLGPTNVKRGKNFLKNIKAMLNRSSQDREVEFTKPSSNTKWLKEKIQEMG